MKHLQPFTKFKVRLLKDLISDDETFKVGDIVTAEMMPDNSIYILDNSNLVMISNPIKDVDFEFLEEYTANEGVAIGVGVIKNTSNIIKL